MMRISFCFLLPKTCEFNNAWSFSNLLRSESLNWLGVFQDEDSLSRYHGGKTNLVRVPEDWNGLDLNKSIVTTVNSFKGVNDFSILGKKRFCIYLENLESLFSREENLYFILNSELPIIAKCSSLETIDYFKKHYDHYFDYHTYGEECSRINKVHIKSIDQIMRRMSWKKSITNRTILFVRPNCLKKFFQFKGVKNLEAIYFAPSVKIDTRILIKCLALKEWGTSDLEIVGNFNENQVDSIFSRLKKLILKQFIQWHYGT